MDILTVADILKLDVLKNVSLCAGTDGLKKAVTGITTAEDPDLLQWLSGGEVLLTSLYGAVLGPFSYSEYIQQLAGKDISALFIKPKAPSEDIPEDIIKGGNDFNIPIIRLPLNTPFIDVISAVMGIILKIKNQYYIEIQNNLSNLLASGAREPQILNYLTQYIPAAISLYDSEKNLTFYSQSAEFQPYRAIADRIKLPIMCMGEVNGYLEAVTNHILDENLEMLLKTAASLLALLYLKKYYVAEIEQKYISTFLADLFEGNIEEEQLEDRTKGYGWGKEDTYSVFSTELAAVKNTSKISEALIEMTQYLSKDNCYFYIKEPYLHVLYRLPGEHRPLEVHSSISAIISELEAFITKKYRLFSFFAGISSITNHVSHIPLKIREASDALQFAHAFKNNIVKYEDMGVLRILAAHSSTADFEQIIPPAVKKLAAYDEAKNTQYLETLDSLLGNNMNLSKTAKQLFIHYKTMLHRMDRICEIAEISLDDRQTRLDIELGVKLYMMLPK